MKKRLDELLTLEFAAFMVALLDVFAIVAFVVTAILRLAAKR